MLGFDADGGIGTDSTACWVTGVLATAAFCDDCRVSKEDTSASFCLSNISSVFNNKSCSSGIPMTAIGSFEALGCILTRNVCPGKAPSGTVARMHRPVPSGAVTKISCPGFTFSGTETAIIMMALRIDYVRYESETYMTNNCDLNSQKRTYLPPYCLGVQHRGEWLVAQCRQS